MEPKLPESTQSQTPEQTPSVPPPPPAQSTSQTTPLSPASDQTPPSSPTQPTNPLANKKMLIIAGGALLCILLLVTVILGFLSNKGSSNQTTNTTTKPTSSVQKQKQATTKPKENGATLVYGTWTSQLSVIRAVDTATSKEITLASLPLRVKKVSVLSKDSLLYIDQIDSHKYGQRISVYNLKQKQITTNIPAASGLSIADYVLSNNKQYLALWEVSLNPETNTLVGGHSVVYSVDLTRPSVINKLYDEQIETTAVHYPRAVLQDGTVFTDKFFPTSSPNDPGWENGISVIDFDGTNQRDVEAVPAGTYGTQPILSHDEKYLIFAGYDNTNGDGTAIKNGVRQAVAAPNTIDLLNTQTLQRFTLPNLPSGTTYTAPVWDPLTDTPVITIFASTSSQPGTYAYDLTKQNLTKLPFDATNLNYISELPKGNTLVGTRSTDAANIGNLGNTDAFAFTQLAIQTPEATTNYLSVQDPFIQYITILPGDYFSSQ